MRRLVIAVLFAAMRLANAETPLDSTECHLKQYGSVDLTLAEQILVPVTINEHRGFMVLNVGDGGTFLWSSFVKDAKLPTYSVGVTPLIFNSRQVKRAVSVQELRLGEIPFRKTELRVSPPVWTGPTGDPARPIIGALGMNMFSAADFELDVARRKLNLFSQDHCPGGVVYWTDDYAYVPLQRDKLGNVFITMELDDRKLHAMLMVASEVTTLNSDVARRVYGFGIPMNRSESRYVAMKMTAPGLTATNVRVDLRLPERWAYSCMLTTHKVARYSGCIGHYPMGIGRNILQELRMYFATKEQILYFSSAAALRAHP